MVLGASQTGKTSIVRQFLYDQFSSRHVETMDDMYRGEFEAANGKMINFDIEDVGATYIYEFPSMKSVSLNSADAFILVFSLDKADTWDEVSKLRDIVRDAKVRFIKKALKIILLTTISGSNLTLISGFLNPKVL